MQISSELRSGFINVADSTLKIWGTGVKIHFTHSNNEACITLMRERAFFRSLLSSIPRHRQIHPACSLSPIIQVRNTVEEEDQT